MKRIVIILLLVLISSVGFSQQKKFVSYTVKAGENMKKIARAYDLSTRDLMRLNPGVGRKPKPNTVIIVPNLNYGKSVEVVDTDNEKYLVQPKETLFGISQKHGITIDELIDANPQLKEGLKIGMRLIIPEPKPVVADSINYVMHNVVKDDTVFNIKQRYNVAEEDLYELNPDLKHGLNLGMVLKIKPIDETEENLFIESLNFSKEINLAVMLPYHLKKFQTDSVLKMNLEKRNSVLNIVTDAHMGIQMAIDSLKAKGLTINVNYFDTENSNYKLQLISGRNDFSNTDAVIGPLFFDKAHWLSKRVSTPVISPIFSKKQDDLNSANLVKSAPNRIMLEESLIDYMKEIYQGEEIIVVNDSLPKTQSQLWRVVNKLKQFDSVQNISVEKLSNGYIDNEKFAEKFIEDKKYWVVLISDSNVGTSAALNNLKALIEIHDIRFFSLYKDANFNRINDNNLLGRLQFVYPTYEYVAVEDETIQRFYNSFKRKNGAYPTKYAIRAFDVTYDAIARLASYNDLKEGVSYRVSSKFDYDRKLFGGLENKGVFLIKYNEDLTIEALE
jgi:LysM repeat protein